MRKSIRPARKMEVGGDKLTDSDTEIESVSADLSKIKDKVNYKKPQTIPTNDSHDSKSDHNTSNSSPLSSLKISIPNKIENILELVGNTKNNDAVCKSLREIKNDQPELYQKRSFSFSSAENYVISPKAESILKKNTPSYYDKEFELSGNEILSYNLKNIPKNIHNSKLNLKHNTQEMPPLKTNFKGIHIKNGQRSKSAINYQQIRIFKSPKVSSDFESKVAEFLIKSPIKSIGFNRIDRNNIKSAYPSNYNMPFGDTKRSIKHSPSLDLKKIVKGYDRKSVPLKYTETNTKSQIKLTSQFLIDNTNSTNSRLKSEINQIPKKQHIIPNPNTSSNHFYDTMENAKSTSELRYDSDTVQSSNIADSSKRISHKKIFPGNPKGISFERRLSKSGAGAVTGAVTKVKKKIEAKVVSGVVFDAAPINDTTDARSLDSSLKSSFENFTTLDEEKNVESSLNKITVAYNLSERKQSLTLNDKTSGENLSHFNRKDSSSSRSPGTESESTNIKPFYDLSKIKKTRLVRESSKNDSSKNLRSKLKNHYKPNLIFVKDINSIPKENLKDNSINKDETNDATKNQNTIDQKNNLTSSLENNIAKTHLSYSNKIDETTLNYDFPEIIPFKKNENLDSIAKNISGDAQIINLENNASSIDSGSDTFTFASLKPNKLKSPNINYSKSEVSAFQSTDLSLGTNRNSLTNLTSQENDTMLQTINIIDKLSPDNLELPKLNEGFELPKESETNESANIYESRDIGSIDTLENDKEPSSEYKITNIDKKRLKSSLKLRKSQGFKHNKKDDFELIDESSEKNEFSNSEENSKGLYSISDFNKNETQTIQTAPESSLYFNDDKKDIRTNVRNMEIENNVSYSQNMKDIDEDGTFNNDQIFNLKIFKENEDKIKISENISSNFETDRKKRQPSLSSSSTDTNATAVTEAVIKKAGNPESIDMDKEFQYIKHEIYDEDLQVSIRVNTKEGSKEPAFDNITNKLSSSESIHSKTPKSDITNNFANDIHKRKHINKTLDIKNGILIAESEDSYKSENINAQLPESPLDLDKANSPSLHQNNSLVMYSEKTNDQEISFRNFENLPTESVDNSTNSQIFNPSNLNYKISKHITSLDKNSFFSNDKISENIESLNNEIEFISGLKYSSGSPKIDMEHKFVDMKSTTAYEVDNSPNTFLSKFDVSPNSGSEIIPVDQENSDSILIIANQSPGISKEDLENKHSSIHDKIEPENEQTTLNTVLDSKSQHFGDEKNEEPIYPSTEGVFDTTYNTAKSDNSIKSSEIDHLKDSIFTPTRSKILRRRIAEKVKIEPAKTDSEFNDMLNSLIETTNHFSINPLLESAKSSSDLNIIPQIPHQSDFFNTKDITNPGIQLTEISKDVKPTDKPNTPEHFVDSCISSPIKNKENFYPDISEKSSINSKTHPEKVIEAKNTVYGGAKNYAVNVNDSEKIENLSMEPTLNTNTGLADSSNDHQLVEEPIQFESSFESSKIYSKDIKDSVILDASMETIIKDIKIGLNNPNDVCYISNLKSYSQNTCIGNSPSSDRFEDDSEEILLAKKSENFCEDESINNKNLTKSVYKRKKLNKLKIMDLPKEQLTNLRNGIEAPDEGFDLDKKNRLPNLLNVPKTSSNELIQKIYSDSVYFEKSPELYSIYAKYSINHINDSNLKPEDVQSGSIVINKKLFYNDENYPKIDLDNKSVIADINQGTIIPYDQNKKKYNSRRRPTVSAQITFYPTQRNRLCEVSQHDPEMPIETLNGMYHNPYPEDARSHFSNSIPNLDYNKKLNNENIDSRTFNVKINRNSSVNISISRGSFIELTKTNSQLFKVLNDGAHFISKLDEASFDHTKESEYLIASDNILNKENVHIISEIDSKVVNSSVEMNKPSKLGFLEHSTENHGKVLDPNNYKESDFNDGKFAISSKYLLQSGKNLSSTSNTSDSNSLIINKTLEPSFKHRSISISYFSPDELIYPLKSNNILIINPTPEKKSYGLKSLLSNLSTKIPSLKNEFKNERSGKREIKKSNLKIKTNTIRSPQLVLLEDNETPIHNHKDIDTEIIKPTLSNESISKNLSSKKSVYSDEKNGIKSANDNFKDNNASSGAPDDINTSSHIIYGQRNDGSAQKKNNKNKKNMNTKSNTNTNTIEYPDNKIAYKNNNNPSYQQNHLESANTQNTQISGEFDSLVKTDDLNLANIDLESFSALGFSSVQLPKSDNFYNENKPNSFSENSLSFFSTQKPLQTFLAEKKPSSVVNSPSSLSNNAITKKSLSSKDHDQKYSDLSLNNPVYSAVENFGLNTVPNNTTNENSDPRLVSNKNASSINCISLQESLSDTLGSNKSLSKNDHVDFSIVNINRPPSKSISYSPSSKKIVHSNIPDSINDGEYGDVINSDIKKSVPRSKSHSNFKSEINSPNKSNKEFSPKKIIDDPSTKKKNISNSNILNKLSNMFSLDKSEESTKIDSDVMDNLSPMEYKKKILYLQKTIDRQNKKIYKLENLVIDKQDELDMATEEILNLKNENGKVLKEKAEIEDEIEELSKSLFTEANNLVKNEAILRHNAEQKVIALEKEIARLKGADSLLKSPHDLGIISPIMDI
ncbi:hypothetical protein AYI69_g3465 [Smittium culicis]|uniref:GDP/GTP exchange factor Sec2 N-terminal domain-containing protein n=1 Tax=Smittium culicis TaxID=133412 RepID=A0A1R1YJN7_9FUNG|nr:hypothetical protein AYI69_g3465 [Smittium culicis]